MTLITLKYGLPILLGYVLFAAISGRIIPILRPKNPQERPAWLLGHWSGIAATTVLILALQLAYAMSVDKLGSLLLPSALAFAALMLPGLIAYSMYKARINRQLADVEVAETAHHHVDQAARNTTLKNEFDHASIDLDATLDRSLDDSFINDLDLHISAEDDMVDDVLLEETNVWSISNDAAGNEFNAALKAEITVKADNIATQATVLASDEFNQAFDVAHAESLNAIQAMQLESSANAESEIEALKALVQSTREEADTLQRQLEAEIAEREKVEVHLRITRKGLAELESESKKFESEKTEALTKLENLLQEKEVRTSKAEAHAQREADKAAALESDILNLRKEALNAATENRASTEARARALSTANKATTFARQAVEVRAKLESQLKDKERMLETRQTTITSLINALDKEKARTKKDVANLAKQMVLEEKQLQARRTIEDAARADSGFTSRLVKKVAKAKAENE